MGAATEHVETTLQIKRTIKAPPEKVFHAWADPQAVAQWMGPSDDMETIVEVQDFNIGGEYRWRMTAKHDTEHAGPKGTTHVVGGRYVAIEPPRLLSFTWAWLENGMDVGESLVTLEFNEVDNGTELVLTHDKLPTPEAVKAHGDGWEGCLNCLVHYFKLAH